MEKIWKHMIETFEEIEAATVFIGWFSVMKWWVLYLMDMSLVRISVSLGWAHEREQENIGNNVFFRYRAWRCFLNPCPILNSENSFPRNHYVYIPSSPMIKLPFRGAARS
jgi:hypothetical protein